ncbi:One of several homologs of bacterial chaperone DnaJ, located in the ER lumen, partial [Protomyces lactucae-debilis]
SLFLLALFVAAKGADYYKVLGLRKQDNPTLRDVKKRYRTLSKQHHPDRNPGNAEAKAKFVEIATAYEVLSDKEKRATYDKYGEEGLKRQEAGGHHDPFDLFSQFFGGGGNGKRRGPNLETVVELDLESLYTGGEFTLAIEKQVVCDVCSGTGSDPVHDLHTCDECSGHGVKLVRHQLAPGMFQQMQMQCNKCGGQGKIISHPCSKCKGNKVYKDKEQFTLDVIPGLPRNHQVVFEGEAEESPDIETGDLIITVRERRDNARGWRRKNSDLYRTEAISLYESLFGFTREIQQLDGSMLKVDRRGKTTQPGQVEVLEESGMPLWNEELQNAALGHGRAFIEFVVVLP